MLSGTWHDPAFQAFVTVLYFIIHLPVLRYINGMLRHAELP